eukprot:756415-Hanusia_phi.AAC.1
MAPGGPPGHRDTDGTVVLRLAKLQGSEAAAGGRALAPSVTGGTGTGHVVIWHGITDAVGESYHT